MIYIYWPGKAMPEWLERIESCEGKPPTLTHIGFGFVVNLSGVYMVYILSGGFMRIDGAECRFTIRGGGKGVDVHFIPPSLTFCALSFLFGISVALAKIVGWLA